MWEILERQLKKYPLTEWKLKRWTGYCRVHTCNPQSIVWTDVREGRHFWGQVASSEWKQVAAEQLAAGSREKPTSMEGKQLFEAGFWVGFGVGMVLARYPNPEPERDLKKGVKRVFVPTKTDKKPTGGKASPKRRKGGLRDWSDTVCQICSTQHLEPHWECPKLREIAAGRSRLPVNICCLCLKEKGGISHNRTSASQPCWMSRKRSDGVQYDFRCQICKKCHFRVCSKCPQVEPRTKQNQQVLPKF